jgi:hypothetical protein
MHLPKTDKAAKGNPCTAFIQRKSRPPSNPGFPHLRFDSRQLSFHKLPTHFKRRFMVNTYLIIAVQASSTITLKI